MIVRRIRLCIEKIKEFKVYGCVSQFALQQHGIDDVERESPQHKSVSNILHILLRVPIRQNQICDRQQHGGIAVPSFAGALAAKGRPVQAADMLVAE